ncbi:MAG: hypothetical protein M9897_01145 [Brumimicrobium sp.]|nr:hypothetical protein [Brumimicrobium sp.]
MKTLTSIFFILASLLTFGQRGTDWIPFKISLVDNKDTLNNNFDFYLISGNKEFRPTINDSLNCFQFHNVDSLVDFNLIYKDRNFKFKNIEAVRLMYYDKWTVTLDTNANNTCYEIIADRAGCFLNVYLGPYPIPECDNKHLIWLTSFQPRQEGAISIRETKKLKKLKRDRK